MVLSVVLKNSSDGPGRPCRPPLPHIQSRCPRPPSRELLQFCLLPMEHRSSAASTKSSPEETLSCDGLESRQKTAARVFLNQLGLLEVT